MLFVLCLLSQPAFATSIVAVRTMEGTFVGFDSKPCHWSAANGKRIDSGAPPQIFQVNSNAYVVTAGLVVPKSEQLPPGIGTEGLPFDTIAEALKSNILKRATSALPNIKIGSWNGPLSSFAIVGNERGVPTILSLQFYASSNAGRLSLQWTAQRVPQQPAEAQYPGFVVLGNSAVVSQYCATHPPVMGGSRQSLLAGIKECFDYAAKNDPAQVCTPINLVDVSRGGQAHRLIIDDSIAPGQSQ